MVSDGALTLDGVAMRAANRSAAGVLDADTTVTFSQKRDIFSARYQGGAIVDGYLIGKLSRDHSLEFRYVQLDTAGNLDSGVSTGALARLPDGRLRLIEDYQWVSRSGSGQNVFEQILV